MGTTKVSAILAERGERGVRVIGVATVPAEGLKQGVVVDIERASRSVERAVTEAERMAGVRLRRFNVGVAGEHIRSMNSRGVVGIPSGDHRQATSCCAMRAGRPVYNRATWSIRRMEGRSEIEESHS